MCVRSLNHVYEFHHECWKRSPGNPGTSILGHSQSLAAFVSELVDLALKLPSLECVFGLRPTKSLSCLDYFIPAGFGGLLVCWIESSASFRYILTHVDDTVTLYF